MQINLFNKAGNTYYYGRPANIKTIEANLNFNPDASLTAILGVENNMYDSFYIERDKKRYFYRKTLSAPLSNNSISVGEFDMTTSVLDKIVKDNKVWTISRCHSRDGLSNEVVDTEFNETLNTTGKGDFVEGDNDIHIQGQRVVPHLSQLYYVFAVNGRSDTWMFYNTPVSDRTEGMSSQKPSPLGEKNINQYFVLIPLLGEKSHIKLDDLTFNNVFEIVNNLVTKATSKHHQEFIGVFYGPPFIQNANYSPDVQSCYVKMDVDNVGERWVSLLCYWIGVHSGRKPLEFELGYLETDNSLTYPRFDEDSRTLMHPNLYQYVKWKVGENIFSLTDVGDSGGASIGDDGVNVWGKLSGKIGFENGIILSFGTQSMKFSENFFTLRDGYLDGGAQNQASLNAREKSPLNLAGNIIFNKAAAAGGILANTVDRLTNPTPQSDYMDYKETTGVKVANKMYGMFHNSVDNIISWIRGKPTISQLTSTAKGAQSPTTTNGDLSKGVMDMLENKTKIGVYCNAQDISEINRHWCDIGGGGQLRSLNISTACSTGIKMDRELANYPNADYRCYLRFGSAEEVMNECTLFLRDMLQYNIGSPMMNLSLISNTVETLLNGIYFTKN